jgi:alpha-beta hydrolase superfamily lysophospholipase
MGKAMTWIASNPKLAASLGLLTLFVLLNLLAYRHAWTMTHFLPAGGWRVKPEDLTRLQKVRALVAGVHLCRPQSDQRPDHLGLDYETHTFGGTAGSLEAWYLPHPHPSGLVLVFHGYNACKARLLPEARAFHELGYSCFLVDFPGSGGSEGAVTTIGYCEADDVARAVDYARLTWGEQPRTLFGQSMGAVAVLRALALRGVGAEAAVLECPFGRLLNTVKARFGAMGVPSFPAAHALVLWGGILHGYNGFRHNPVAYAGRVACPVLLLHGRDDRRVQTREVEAIYRALRGPRQVHVFEGLGHESYVAQQPQEWKRSVSAFLRRRALAG